MFLLKEPLASSGVPLALRENLLAVALACMGGGAPSPGPAELEAGGRPPGGLPASNTGQGERVVVSKL